jgi:hypothetical protein
MRARNIKPGLFKNEELAECDIFARFMFTGLWCLADREGRLEDRPKRIRAEILPFDECDVNALLDQLAKSGFIDRYEVDGLKLIQIIAFSKHQYPHHREVPSSLPGKPEHKPDKPRASLGQDQGQDAPCPKPAHLNPSSLNPSSLNPINTPLPPKGDVLFDQFWEVFPSLRKEGKDDARRAWKKAIKKETPEVIIQAAIEYAASPVGRGAFVKGPSPWLNKGCWEDDRTAWQRQDTNGTYHPPPKNLLFKQLEADLEAATAKQIAAHAIANFPSEGRR